MLVHMNLKCWDNDEFANDDPRVYCAEDPETKKACEINETKSKYNHRNNRNDTLKFNSDSSFYGCSRRFYCKSLCETTNKRGL